MKLSTVLSTFLIAAALLRGATTPTPAIKINPSSATLRAGDHKTFTASPSNIAKPALSWSISPSGAGSGLVTNGEFTYTAPATLPASNAVTIKVTDASGVSATAAVTLENPLPAISSLTPSSVNTGLPYTVSVKGTGFIASSQVLFDGKPAVGAKLISSTEIQLAATSTLPAGTKIAVTVVNPNPGGATSASRTLTVQAPVAVTVSPDKHTLRLGLTQTFTARVANNADQTVTWAVAGGAANGSIDAKGVYTPPLVLPPVPAPVTPNAAGTAPALPSVTITATAAADKNAIGKVTLFLENGMPVITSVAPTSLNTGTRTLTVNGKDFASGAVIWFAGAPLTTRFVSATQLTATFLVTLPLGGVAAVKVANPAPGPETSFAIPVPVSVANPKIAWADAVRFLEMATFGPSPASIQHLQEIGIDAWLSEQLDFAKTPPSAWPLPNDSNEQNGRLQDAFFTNALTGKDQLRQRVAFALSEILVVSGVKDTKFAQMVSYLQLLNNDAFGHYRDLLGDITLNPAMGYFLDMVNNAKASADGKTVANENYAREVMQLFSLGLVQLDPTATPLPGNPTEYDQSTVTEMAKVFTGWTYPSVPGFASHWKNPEYYDAPMVAFDDYHDKTAKNINLPIPCSIGPGGSAVSDLNQALDCIAKQKNVAPFISYRLIQRLVKSSPSKQFVSDIATVFADPNDFGNLAKVVRAILTHPEASAEGTGKLREPVIQATTLLRELNATVTNAATGVEGWSETMGQKVLMPGSVFSYFSPSFRIAGLVPPPIAPEFQAMNAETEFGRVNFAYRAVTNGVSGNIKVNFANWQDLAADKTAGPAQLVNAINQALYRGEMTANEQTAVQGAAALSTDPLTRVRDAAYVAAAAPQYQVAGTPLQ